MYLKEIYQLGIKNVVIYAAGFKETDKKGEGFVFVNGIKGGAIPREYIPGVEKGLLDGINTGVIAGFDQV